MTPFQSYVMDHSIRGDCICGKCIDAVTNAHQPEGEHTADLVFFKVAAAQPVSAADFLAFVEAEFPHWVDGKEHGYMEMGGDIGDQGLALQAMGLGAVLGVWDLLTPRMLPISEELQMKMAGMGMVSIQRPSRSLRSQ